MLPVRWHWQKEFVLLLADPGVIGVGGNNQMSHSSIASSFPEVTVMQLPQPPVLDC